MEENVLIHVEGLSKEYLLNQSYLDENNREIFTHQALKDVNLTIFKGENVGIIGPNGSGKSTLLKILAGVIKPSAGTVRIRGKVASVLDVGAGFHPELSGRENIFLNGQIHGFSKQEIKQKLPEILAFSEIEKFIDQPIKNYSNGMYLRLAFSIITHLDFDIYLLDEVMAVGDVDFRKKCQQRIQYLSQLGKTFVVISHNWNEIAAFADVVHVLNNGNVSPRMSLVDALEKYNSQRVEITKKPEFLHEAIFKVNGNTLVDAIIENDQPVELEFELNLPSLFKRYSLALYIVDQLENVLFNISPDLTPNGIKKVNHQDVNGFTYTIPPLFFNEGSFYVGLIFFEDDRVAYDVANVLSFRIQLSNRFKNEFGLGTKGPLKLIRDWKLK